MPPPSFLLDHLPLPSSSSRPHITLTWAQSLDAKIAGPGGERVILSGPESMEMTHWMRSMHDSILIGVNTLILDDPRLQINLLPDSPELQNPQPLILDPQLRFPLTSRILKTYLDSGSLSSSPAGTSRKPKQPWIICGDNVDPFKREEVEKGGGRVMTVPLDSQGRIPPSSLPTILSSLGLKSVMIEGGSRILSSFLHSPFRDDGSRLVDSVVVTVAPTFIGEGIGVVPEGDDIGLPRLKTVRTEVMGKDAVMICTVELPSIDK